MSSRRAGHCDRMSIHVQDSTKSVGKTAPQEALHELPPTHPLGRRDEPEELGDPEEREGLWEPLCIGAPATLRSICLRDALVDCFHWADDVADEASLRVASGVGVCVPAAVAAHVDFACLVGCATDLPHTEPDHAREVPHHAATGAWLLTPREPVAVADLVIPGARRWADVRVSRCKVLTRWARRGCLFVGLGVHHLCQRVCPGLCAPRCGGAPGRLSRVVHAAVDVVSLQPLSGFVDGPARAPAADRHVARRAYLASGRGQADIAVRDEDAGRMQNLPPTASQLAFVLCDEHWHVPTLKHGNRLSQLQAQLW
eukprot:CAMPEP_0175385300 /NCGR_PEP_ID=MMETSP0095-20121207/28780_1 /TAXON_ID=311494 /ORGANISM="Alexandrium monilatum, Strain CCMP3105" /LENGTH=312 /DNA_ID=CAMNT_0016683731 /DNA_START=21 /DNA_END=956 /DNA_ORIENTATION=+